MNIKEYLNPKDWSLHLVNVDNDAAGKDWIEVPEGATRYTKGGFFKSKGEFFNRSTQEWRTRREGWAGFRDVLWKRHTHPEELPFVDDFHKLSYQSMLSINSFVDDEAKTAWDKQEGGSHYKYLKIQPMQYALENKLDYAQANVVKYVTRHASKNGKEDLLKAIHNIELMIEYYYGDKEQSQ